MASTETNVVAASPLLVEVKNVKRGGKTMKGVVALVDIPAFTFIGNYDAPMLPLSEREAMLAELKSQEERVRHSTYDLIDPFSANVYVPVDTKTGELIAGVESRCVAYFVNEASEDAELPNVNWCLDMHRKEVAFVTNKIVRAGEECLCWYGPHYIQEEYKVKWTTGKSLEECERATRSVIFAGNILHETGILKVLSDPDSKTLTAFPGTVISNLDHIAIKTIHRVPPKNRFANQNKKHKV
jgi:hypothetical protein